MIYVTDNISIRPSNHGGSVALIKLYGEDGEKYHTWVYDQCDNEKLWYKIINNPDKIFAFEHYKLKKAKDNLLNADHQPEYLQEIDKEMRHKMLSHWGIR